MNMKINKMDKISSLVLVNVIRMCVKYVVHNKWCSLQNDFIKIKGWMIFMVLQMKYIKEGEIFVAD